MSAICDGCRKAAMYTVTIGQMTVCEECTDKAWREFQAKKDFELWMSQVDKKVISMSGVSVYDLPDVAFRVNFDDGTLAEEMAETALQEAGWPG